MEIQEGRVQQSTASLNDTRRSILLDLITKRYKGKKESKQIIQQEVEFYMEKLEQEIPVLIRRPQGELTDAEKINDEMLEYEIDIHSVFSQLEHIGTQIKKHQRLNESVLNEVRMKTRRSDETLESHRQRIMDSSIHKVSYETFLDFANVETDDRYYTDRYGAAISSENKLKLDMAQSALKLPAVYVDNCLLNHAGVKLGTISIKKQLGSGFVSSKNPEHDINKAIDNSMESFWSENILSDSPIRVNMGLDYYGVNFGAVCTLEVKFDFITRINEITFTPFTQYPMEVLAIHAYANDYTDDKEEFDLVSPNAYLKGKESTETMSFQFQDIVCKRLVIILNQRHYVKRDMLVEMDNKDITDVWLKNQGFIEPSENTIFKPIYRDQFAQHPNHSYMQEYMKGKDLKSEIGKFADDYVTRKMQISKYEYQYGLYNMAINRNEYLVDGVYVTKRIGEGNIHTVTLDALEEHQTLPEVNIPVTNIEYYITDSENPAPSDWVSILPTNTDVISSERLFFDFDYEISGRYTASTRFIPDIVSAVRRNGDVLVPYKDYELMSDRIMVYQYDASAIYTIDYKATEDAYKIDFLKRYTTASGVKPKTVTEQFDGLDKISTLTLANTPFVDKEKLNAQPLTWNPTYQSNAYSPMTVKLVLPNGQRIEQAVYEEDKSICITNKTDYFNQTTNLLEPFSATRNNYQYRVEGSQIKFNTTLPKGTHAIVHYPYLTGPIRMKIIMRRNMHDIEGLTPFLHEYKVKFQSLK